MEGNACYKYHSVRRFVAATNTAPIQTILEIGANVGDITLELADCFPDARIASYELLESYARIAQSRTARLSNVTVDVAAVTAAHLYEDDLATFPRNERAVLHRYLAQPVGGPGYRGGSFFGMPGGEVGDAYRELPGSVKTLTLDEVVEAALFDSASDCIDYLKSDCEGAECSFLGCANKAALEKIRFMAGEYHNLQRFWPVAQKLMATHYVNLIGEADLGAFFCERIGPSETLLHKSPLEPRRYPHLVEEPLYWHPFDKQRVLIDERLEHGITG